MKGSTKKISLSVLLLFITFSFSGCLGLGSSNLAGNSAERSDSYGVFKTVDGGKTWERKIAVDGGATDLSQTTITSMAIDPVNTNVLYLGTAGDGMYKTENSGDSWYKISDANNKMRSTASIYDIAIESGNSNIIYAASLNDNRGVLLKSEDAGKNWTESYITTQQAKQVNRVQIDPIQKNVIYIGTQQGGFIKSSNRGIDWEPIRWFSTPVKDFVIDHQNTKGLIVLSDEGLFKAVDGGTMDEKNWKDLTKALVKTGKISNNNVGLISSVTIDSQNPLVVYLTYKNLIFVTSDGGNTWKIVETITPALKSSTKVPGILKVGSMDGIIYYGSGNAIYKSNNRGDTWSSFDIPVLGNVKYTVSDPKDHNIIYVGSVPDAE